jgi:hypothetical protein
MAAVEVVPFLHRTSVRLASRGASFAKADETLMKL